MNHGIKDNDVNAFIDETFGALNVRREKHRFYQRTGTEIYDSFYDWAFQKQKSNKNESYAYTLTLKLIQQFKTFLLCGCIFNAYIRSIYNEQNTIQIEREIGSFKLPSFKKGVKKALEKIASFDHQFLDQQTSLFVYALHEIGNDYFSTIIDSLEYKEQ